LQRTAPLRQGLEVASAAVDLADHLTGGRRDAPARQIAEVGATAVMAVAAAQTLARAVDDDDCTIM